MDIGESNNLFRTSGRLVLMAKYFDHTSLSLAGQRMTQTQDLFSDVPANYWNSPDFIEQL